MVDTKKCSICGYIYNPENGEEKRDLAPGTVWEDVPEEFTCPLCGAKRTMFK